MKDKADYEILFALKEPKRQLYPKFPKNKS